MSESLDEEVSLALVVQSSASPGELIVADNAFMAAIETAENRLVVLKVSSPETAAEGARLQEFLTGAGKALETERLKLLRPFIDAQNAINAAAKNAAARIDLAKQNIKQKITQYDSAQRDLAAARERERLAEVARVERVRVAEIQRLQRIADQEKAEADRKAAELLRQQEEAERARLAAIEAAKPKPSAPEDLDDEPDPSIATNGIDGFQPRRTDMEELDLGEPPAPEKSETVKKLEALKVEQAAPPAAPIVAPKIAGLSFRTWLEIVSVDVNQLPDAFVIREPNMAELRSVYCVGWKENSPIPQCPGVVFATKRESITRGK